MKQTPKISILAEMTRVSVITVSETWLDNWVTDAEAAVPGYNITRKDRQSLGGVCIYIQETLGHNLRTDLQNDSIKGIWVELLLTKTKLILIECLYIGLLTNTI